MGSALKLAPLKAIHSGSSLIAAKVNFLRTAKLDRLWVDLLRLQNQYYSHQDLAFLRANLQLKNALSVADFGSGPGHYINVLAKQYPDTTFYGFDRDPNFVSYAKAHSSDLSNAHFLTSDVYAIKKHQFDLISLRMVVQHLSEQRKLLRTLKNNLKPEGHVYIFEACDALTRLTPALSSVTLLFMLMRDHQAKKGATRDFLPSFLGHVAKSELSLASYQQKPITAHDFKQKALLAAILCHVGAVATQAFRFDFDLLPLVRDLEDWKNDATTAGQLGVQQLLLKKNL